MLLAIVVYVQIEEGYRYCSIPLCYFMNYVPIKESHKLNAPV